MDSLQRIVREAAAAGRFSGVVRVQRGDEVLFSEAAGLADRTWGVPNEPGTRFRIASIGKPFTAVAALQQIAAGQLELETPIAPFLELAGPGVPPTVTVYHLLTMTGGIPDWFKESEAWAAAWEELRREHPLYLLRTAEDYLPLFLERQPLFVPGACYRYNNAGYILLGMVVARAAGQPYFDYVANHIFKRACMAATGFPALDEISPGVASGYIPIQDEGGEPAGWKRNIYHVTPGPAADGGATSSAADLIRFSQALRQNELLPPALTAAMLSPQVADPDFSFRDYSLHYGFGMQLLASRQGRVLRYGHTGEEDGIRGRLFYYPESDLDVVILANQSWSTGKLGFQIHDLILEENL